MSTTFRGEPLWTVPNAISVLRVLGLVPLLWTAYGGHRHAFVWILVLLLFSDWLDGKLAILLDQETTFGARFDSFADMGMYAAIALSFWWLEATTIRAYLPWLVGVAAAWGASAVVALARFGRLPSYHTRGVKATWLAAGVAAVLLVTGNDVLVPWALGLAILANLEGVAIGAVLPEWRANVASVREAARIRRRADG